LRSDAEPAGTPHAYEGLTPRELAERLRVPRVVTYSEIGSTQDAAHDLAANGARAGTLLLADAQSAGRGRAGRTWESLSGAGVWMTMIERPRDVAALDVLSLRVGLALAPALDSLSGDSVGLKWPNDLYLGRRKLAGVLVEARWRDGAPEWVAIGVGINVRAPESEKMAIGLSRVTTRLAVLDRCVPAIRAAASAEGGLRRDEVAAFEARDLAVGRECISPAEGIVRGIDSSGALVIAIGSESIAARSGSLVFREEG
jgi:BirA family transcriptional regulator, biotin operon repressor / biotin---[acetyl-CoA-carboxylase] ligase